MVKRRVIQWILLAIGTLISIYLIAKGRVLPVEAIVIFWTGVTIAQLSGDSRRSKVRKISDGLG